MAKRKLFIGNYTFDAANSIVTLPDNIAPERLLLITNVTLNKQLYNFADPNLGYEDIFFDNSSDTTFIRLKVDSVSLGAQDTDRLQIFIDVDYQIMEPSETFVDPVSKIRVSNPENLIDTDFEYGTQSSKWETLQTVNNVPTIYSTNGDKPLENIVSVETSNGSRQVKVTTSLPHGLQIGDPITVQGLTEFLAEGAFLISGLGGANIFFYEMDQEVNVSGPINGSYTTIIPSKFFEGSNLILDEENGGAIVTDTLNPSSIEVSTRHTHGFDVNAKMYLRNTVGPKNLIIEDSTAVAIDGRPVVDTVERLTETVPIDNAIETGRTGILKKPVITYDWTSTYNKLLDVSEVNDVNNTVSWTNHNLKNNFCLLYSDPIRGKTNGGLVDGYVYYVKVIDENTIQLCTDQGTLTSIVDISAPDTSYGHPILNLVYKIEGSNNTQRRTAFSERNQSTTTSGVSGSGFGSRGTTAFSLGTFGGQDVISATLTFVSVFVSTRSRFMTLSIGGGAYSVSSGTATSRSQNYFPNTNITNFIFKSGNSWFINYSVSSNSSWSFSANITIQTRSATIDVELSGSDLGDSTWGLGVDSPNKIIAFQGKTPGSFATTSDSYSYLDQQRTNARYNTVNPYYNYVPVSANRDGTFVFNYNDSGNASYGTTSEIFYVFIKDNTNFRNTIYYPGHGFDDGDDATINIINYTTTNKFSFNGSTGQEFPILSNTFSATISKISNSLIRLQINESPNTNDIAAFPQQFEIVKNFPNPTYNTIYIPNHKITSNATATYSATNPITPLVSGNQYLLERYNDSRLYVRETSLADAITAVTAPVGNNLDSPTSFDINFSTPLGEIPQTATITKLEFRGNFGNTNEYVQLTFEDGYVFFAGVRGQDSSIWQEDTTWTSKDVSSILKTITGGATGISVVFDPTPNVIFSRPIPGMTNRWEIRFTITGQTGTLVISNSGSGDHKFEADSILGAYDGIYPITQVTQNNKFKLNAAFEIPERIYEFTETAINIATNSITLELAPGIHNLVTGQSITYDPGTATSIFDNTDGNIVYVIAESETNIGIAYSYLDAINNIRIPLNANTGTHSFKTKNIFKSVKGTGSVSASADSNLVIGNGTSFLNDYKRFDEFWVTESGYVKSYVVERVLTDEKMELASPVANDIVAGIYYFTTQVIPRPDGYSLHKPFDGGIDITAGTSPKSKISRQTRKYFRYQSGKGIQNSFAINFSPSKVVNFITSDGNIATVQTQELHNLRVGESIIINDAVVTSGENFYNGIFTVSEVINAYTFKYVMSGVPLEEKASGFPSYSRNGWRDSAIRAGMFDEQNGFFYEYDGQDLYAVRRSSTLQVSGFINTTKSSQILTGLNTSFSTQLRSGDNIVVRGQSYKVVEVSSDNRLIIQPPYRGVSATKVKITKTIDTKVPQREWNIDRCDGTGNSGFILDINKIQMAYADYSWYGAGKIRFGFKDQNGHVKYVHEFKHNNRLLESYFRSGNLPGRYEIENGTNPNTAPTLFHFGTSVIMDGTFDDDKAYLFTSNSKPFVFTNGASSTVTSSAASTIEQITVNGVLVYVYAIPVSEANASAQTVGSLIRDPNNTNIPEGTYIVQVRVDGADSKIYISYPGTITVPSVNTIASGTVLTIGEIEPVDLTKPIPLVSLRLAPSVDSGVTGSIGERDIINRMQLTLRKAGITTNKNLEAYFILNGLPSSMNFEKVQTPSLSEVIYHSSGDLIQQGTTIFSTKVSPGSVDIDLSELTDMGNSILGGDGVFPSGPDLITVAVLPQDTSTISGSDPLFCTGKITWTESQA